MSRYDYDYRDHEPELGWGAFYITMTLVSYLASVLGAMSVATGLFYLAELAEEFPTLTKRVLKGLLGVVCALLTLFMVIDGLSPWRCCASVLFHVLYAQLLRGFPWINLTSPLCIGCIAAFLCDNVSWYLFFTSNGGHFPFWSVISFFLLCVWSAPLGFFISLAATEDQLPHGGFSDAKPAGSKRRTISAVLSSLASGSFWAEKP